MRNKNEMLWLHTRELLAAMYNTTFGNKKSYKGTDFYKLKSESEAEYKRIKEKQAKIPDMIKRLGATVNKTSAKKQALSDKELKKLTDGRRR